MIIVAEDGRKSRLVCAQEVGGFGIDAVWNDDFHHSALVPMTGRRQAYYSDHSGSAQEFIAAAKVPGYLFQGQIYLPMAGRSARPARSRYRAGAFRDIRGEPRPGCQHRPRQALPSANDAGPGTRHDRAHVALARDTHAVPRAGVLGDDPLLYFADAKAELDDPIRQGRNDFLAQFPSLADEEMVERLADPGDPRTFAGSTLDWHECERRSEILALHRDLLRLRRHTPAFAAQRYRGVDGVVLGAEAFVLRFFDEDGGDRLSWSILEST